MNDRIEQIKTGIDEISKIINKYKHLENVEIELRIGVFEKGSFRPGLGSKEFFTKIGNLLESNPNWVSKNTIKTNELINKGIVQIGKDKIKKTKLYNATFSFENTPYDFRLSVSTENKTTDKIQKSHGIKREKTRYTYEHSDCKYDLTHVIQENNSVKEEIFEFEIELLHLQNEFSDVYRAHSVLLKLSDIINHCEHIVPSSKISLIKDETFLNIEKLSIS
jgi:hypothetical protein